MRKKSGVGSGVGGVGGVCNQRDSFSVAIQKKDYPHVSATDAEGVTYGSMRIVIYKNTEDETSHPLGLVVPTHGTTSPNGWDNNRFRSQAIFGIETPQCDVCLYLHQDRCTLIYWCRINFIYTLHTPLHTPLIQLT